MSILTEVDVAPEATGEENVGSPIKPSTGLTQSDLANVFSQGVKRDVPDKETDTGDTLKVEKPASEPDSESESDDEDSSLTVEDSVDSEPEEIQDEKSSDDKEESEEPTWFRKRIDKITAQRKDAEERVTALEKKLEEKEAKETPVNSVEQVMNLDQLNALEQQAIDAEDQVDDLLETEPKYDDDGEAYWQVGENKMTRKQLIDIRKNARQAFRSVPTRKQFLQQKAQYDATAEKYPYMSDPSHPYYGKAQETLNNKMFKDMETQHPGMKIAVAAMMEGLISWDEKAKQAKAQKAPAPKPATIKSTPTSRAATDQGAAIPAPTTESNERKRIDNLKKFGNVQGTEAVANFFR